MIDNQLCIRVSRRIMITFISIGIVFLVMLGRLSYLQINLSDYFFTRSQQNFLHIGHTLSARGTIIDYRGKLLATNRPRTLLIWVGTGNRKLTPEQLHALNTITTILALSPEDGNTTMHDVARAEHGKKNTTLHTDLTVEQLSKISELYPHDHNIQIISDFQRYYPYHTYASHLLGYLGTVNTENYGKMGLEKLLEESLRGQKGTELNIIDSVGRNITRTTLQQALIGHDIQTTLDIEIQD